MEVHDPWGSFGAAPDMPYSAWHIRTSDGEKESFSPESHGYIFHVQSAADVCPLFISAEETVRAACPALLAGRNQATLVFISSNR